jgi:cation:H+ antiporter
MAILFLLVGLALILLGANCLTDGASAVARRFNISSLVIGLTIVAFGTSTPELVVSVISALKGSDGIAVGNIVGSNIFNALMIVGCTAVIAPIRVTKGTMSHEIPLSILASVVLFIFSYDILFGNGHADLLTRSDGLVLLCFFAIFLSYTFAIAHKHNEESETEVKEMKTWKSIVWIVGGLAALIFGGEIFVNGASAIARSLGVNDAIIGLTIVAGGTSLPELATSIVAARKNNPDMAIGNVIGSNIFNIFLILGCSATISPLNASVISNVDMLTLVGSGVLLYLFSLIYKERTITRPEGVILIISYIAYVTYLICV